MWKCPSCEEMVDGSPFVTPDGDFLCADCYRSDEEHRKEMEFLNWRMEYMKKWVSEQGDVSLEQLMEAAYSNFVHFHDFGLVLHIYMQARR